MTRSRNPARRCLQMESLESRNLMAGSVTAVVTDGVLRIQGDEAANDVQIYHIPQTVSGDWPGANYQIVGRSRDGKNLTTTINGQSSIFIEGVKRGVSIGLGAGDNFLQVHRDTDPFFKRAALLHGTVTINTAGGDDLIRMCLNNRSQVTINSGGGDDHIVLAHSTFNKLTVNADWPGAAALSSAGNDYLFFNLAVHGAARFYMGPDRAGIKDDMSIQNSHFYAGLHFIGPASEFTFAGAGFGPRWHITGSVDIVAQRPHLGNATVTGSVTMTGNGRTNVIDLHTVVITEGLTMRGLGGDDALILTRVTASETVIDGGEGSDTYRDRGRNDLGAFTAVGIERNVTG